MDRPEPAQTVTSIIGNTLPCSLTRTLTLNPDKAVLEASIAFSGWLFISLKWPGRLCSKHHDRAPSAFPRPGNWRDVLRPLDSPFELQRIRPFLQHSLVVVELHDQSVAPSEPVSITGVLRPRSVMIPALRRPCGP